MSPPDFSAFQAAWNAQQVPPGWMTSGSRGVSLAGFVPQRSLGAAVAGHLGAAVGTMAFGSPAGQVVGAVSHQLAASARDLKNRIMSVVDRTLSSILEQFDLVPRRQIQAPPPQRAPVRPPQHPVQRASIPQSQPRVVYPPLHQYVPPGVPRVVLPQSVPVMQPRTRGPPPTPLNVPEGTTYFQHSEDSGTPFGGKSEFAFRGAKSTRPASTEFSSTQGAACPRRVMCSGNPDCLTTCSDDVYPSTVFEEETTRPPRVGGSYRHPVYDDPHH